MPALSRGQSATKQNVHGCDLLNDKRVAVPAAGGARVVNVASNYAGNFDLDDLQFDKRRYDATRYATVRGTLAFRLKNNAHDAVSLKPVKKTVCMTIY